MTIFNAYQARFEAAREEEMSLQEYLELCRNDRSAYATAAERMLMAIGEPEFMLHGPATSTGGSALMVIVNGPIAARLGLNGGANLFGPGYRANATIGRTLRLVLLNCLDCRPGVLDKSTQGWPGKYSLCFAENEAASPWEPLHVERGFAPGESTVTVVGAEGTMNMNTHSKDAAELVRVIAETIIHPPSNDYVHGGEPWLMLSPEHAEVLKRGGLGKPQLKRALWEASKMAAGRFSTKELQRARDSRGQELGEIVAKTLVPASPRAEDVQILVAGGPGTHSVYIPSFGNTRSVTRLIEA